MAATSASLTATDEPTHVTVRFDGSVLGENSDDTPSASIGYVIEDSMAAERIASDGRPLDYWVSNVHVEFDALLAALDHLLELGHTGHVNVCGDAECVIDLVDPDCPATPNDRLMDAYVRRARARLERFDSYTLNYVRRKNNSEADELADMGHTRRAEA